MSSIDVVLLNFWEYKPGEKRKWRRGENTSTSVCTQCVWLMGTDQCLLKCRVQSSFECLICSFGVSWVRISWRWSTVWEEQIMDQKSEFTTKGSWMLVAKGFPPHSGRFYSCLCSYSSDNRGMEGILTQNPSCPSYAKLCSPHAVVVLSISSLGASPGTSAWLTKAETTARNVSNSAQQEFLSIFGQFKLGTE